MSLESRVAKLEKHAAKHSKIWEFMPMGFLYGEAEPYLTDEEVKPLSAFYTGDEYRRYDEHKDTLAIA